MAPTTPAASDPTTFNELMPRVTKAVVDGKIPTDALAKVVAQFALPNIPALATRPDLVAYVWASLVQLYPGAMA
jgi:hypothetical protein